ncbi:MAG: alkane 1-monooxygenase [Rhizobacter sp.]|nr:alkane 1-monooxygenase [Rhizobacter sp.]
MILPATSSPPWLPGPSRFALAWTLPLAIAAAAWVSPWAAWGVGVLVQVGLALLERVPGNARSPQAVPASRWFALVLWVHAPLQFALLGIGAGVAATLQDSTLAGWGAVLALGIAVGGVTGSQGITFAHELGHSRRRFDRALAWLLMASVNYSHFMVEHYRGHHPRAATRDDPASARRGESLWRFLPRTLVGSWRSAWRLESQRLRQFGLAWWRSTLLWATVGQGVWLGLLVAWLGQAALLFWLVQSAYAVFLLETINYIEHYGLRRREVGGRVEPFGMMHAWNADHCLTNCFVVNLQRHSDHHLHAWKPYPELQALPGPQLPTGYAGCLLLATIPPLWFKLMHPRLAALPPILQAQPGPS